MKRAPNSPSICLYFWGYKGYRERKYVEDFFLPIVMCSMLQGESLSTLMCRRSDMLLNPYKSRFKKLKRMLEKEAEYGHWSDSSGDYALKSAIKWTEECYYEALALSIVRMLILVIAGGVYWYFWW